MKYPGRDLGGFLSFVQGFTLTSWIACLVFVFSVPVVFFLIYLVLSHNDLEEVTQWSYSWNLYFMLGAVVQQVQ